ncbi:MAG: hypothetical protein ACI30A_02105 [Paludibacteraceae bacterium]
MKKWLIFGGGVLTGVVLTFLVAFLFALGSTEKKGVTWFDEPGELVEQGSFEVFQVLESNFALVRGKDSYYSTSYFGAVYLLTNDDNKYYYDDEIVKVPSGMVVRQVGMYQYQTKNESWKTVPIIKIMRP